MKNPRRTLLEWTEKGHLAPDRLRSALLLTGVLPSAADWRHFLDRLFLWLGTVFVVAGVVFFFAYNWNDLGRFSKIVLMEALLATTLFFVWRLGLEGLSGKAALVAASVCTGALFALIGQIYQTGADTYELFASWAAFILPWAVAGRFATLWILWITLVNVAVVLYHQIFGDLFGISFGPKQTLWVLFALNATALLLWEGLILGGIEWLQERWAPRVLATVAGSLVTFLALSDVLDERVRSGMALPIWLGWSGLVYLLYRRHTVDVYGLAGGVLSFIIVVTVTLGKVLSDLRAYPAGSLLLIGLVVIGLSAAGGWWLKQVVKEEVA